jgi:phage major head subunit gpT-like protein
MIQNQSTLDAANAAFYAKFDEVFAAQPPGPWKLYTEEINTGSKVNELDILETMPVVREWIGSKVFQSIRASNLTATVKKYEKSFAIDRLDLAADKLGMIGRRISMFMSGDASTIYDKICLETLVSNSGNGPTCYDGQALFSASHPRSSGTTWSNKSTTAFSFAQFDTLVQAGASRTDDAGEPLRIAYDTLIVGPKLWKLAAEVTQSTERIAAVDNSGAESGTRVAAASIPNVYGGGSMTLVVDPRLVGTFDDYYYLIDSSRGPKPLVMFSFRSPTPYAQDGMESEGRFMEDQFRYSVEADFVVTAGSPHVCQAGIL